MPGRILIADDRFASRLMLTALFSGAYYDILQADQADQVQEIVRAEQPGAVLIADGISGPGAVALCSALRADAACRNSLRIVITDRPDPGRAAVFIEAGADEVIARTARDEEVLARVRRVFDHRARGAELSLRSDPSRSGGLSEEEAGFVGMPRIAVVGAGAATEEWATLIGRFLSSDLGPCTPFMAAPDGPVPGQTDVIVIDSESLGRDATLRRIARLKRSNDEHDAQILVGLSGRHADMAAAALDLGANAVAHLPFEGREMAARIGLLLSRKREIARLQDRLRNGLKSAVTDPLTGAFNRRYALPRLERLLSDVSDNGRPLALIMADLDHFKRINDTYGHLAGDAVLCAVADRLRAASGPPGFAARIGGEEFLIVLPACGKLAAMAIAQRVAAAIRRTAVPYPDVTGGLSVTVSIGVAVANQEKLAPDGSVPQSAARLLAAADRALYQAKAAGRDQVWAASPEESDTAAEPTVQALSG